MSHFTKCALKMTNLAAIKKALADMKHEFVEAEQGQAVTVWFCSAYLTLSFMSSRAFLMAWRFVIFRAHLVKCDMSLPVYGFLEL